VFNAGEELDVGGESTPHRRAGRGAQTQGELALEHEDAGSGERTGGEKFEDERRGDLKGGKPGMTSRLKHELNQSHDIPKSGQLGQAAAERTW
jgi:hypothetical protein